MFLILKIVFFTSHTDGSPPFAVAYNIIDVIQSLQKNGENLITWFSDNQMKLNVDKCHLILNIKEKTTLEIGNLHIKNLLRKNLLNFAKHIDNICQRASRKLNALAKLASCMTSSKKIILMNAFFKFQFNYCPLI